MKRRLLALFKVSAHPDPPPGGTEGLETFRPSRRFLYYSFVRWLPKQINALIGILVSLAFIGVIDLGFFNFDFVDIGGLDDLLEDEFGDVTVGLGPVRFELFRTLHYLEFLAIGTFLLQFIVSGLLLRLSWELRWYMVGEEALRIRTGLWHLREQTMTIANIQNMSIRQGPVQKLFGIADLEIQTAGGGAKKDDGEEKPDHVGRFEGLDNAEELRERLRSRLVRDRGTGLGDVEDDDEHEHEHEHEHDVASLPLSASTSASTPASASDGALVAARQLLEEARALRRAVGEAS